MTRQNTRRFFKFFGIYFASFVIFVTLMISSCDPLSPPIVKDYCLFFDGQNDKVVIHDNDQALDRIDDQITLEAWIKVEGVNNLVGRIIDRSDNQFDDRYVIEVYQLGDQQIVHLNINRNNLWSPPIPLNEWIHIAGTYNGEQIKLYINGSLQDSLQVQTTIDVNESDLFIGGSGSNSQYPGTFSGAIDEIKLWSQARTREQVRQDMSWGVSSNPQGLVCYWPVNAGSGQVLYDEQRNADGQLGSTPGIDDDDPEWKGRMLDHDSRRAEKRNILKGDPS